MTNSAQQIKMAAESPGIDSYPDIISLQPNMPPEKLYPVEALPNIVRSAVVAYQEYGQQPIPLIANSALSAMSFASQGLANVARDKHLVGPISLNLITIAKSGERKTTADKTFMKDAREWERQKIEECRVDAKANRNKQEFILEQKKAVKSHIKSATRSNESAELEGLEKKLNSLNEEEPQPSSDFQAIYQDVNQQTLVVCLAKNYPSAALFSDEAAVLIGGNAMSQENALQFFGVCNTLWDGSSYRRNRLNADDAFVVGRRLTFSLMMQFSVLQELLGIKNGQGRSTGFLARYLFAYPSSTMGTRLYKEAFNSEQLEPFHDRIRKLLDTPLPVKNSSSMQLEPCILELSEDAREIWQEYYNLTEQQLGANGILAKVDDFAAKSAENAARIAAIFHIFESGPQGVIQGSTMNRAVALASWYLSETLRIFAALNIPEDKANAQKLIDWIITQPENEFTTKRISQYGPNSLRAKNKWEPALKELVAHYYLIHIEKENIYRLNPKARSMK